MEQEANYRNELVNEALQRKELWPALLTCFLQHFADSPLDHSFAPLAEACTQSLHTYKTHACEVVVYFLQIQPLPDWEVMRLTHLLAAHLLSSSAGKVSLEDTAFTTSAMLYGTQYFLSNMLIHMQHCIQQLHEARAMECLAAICEGISFVAQEGLSPAAEEETAQRTLTTAQEKLQQEPVAEKVIETLYRTFHFMTKHLHRRVEGERVLVAASLALTNLALHDSQRTILLYRSHALETFDEILNSSFAATSRASSDGAVISDEASLKAMFGAIRNISNAYTTGSPQFHIIIPTQSETICPSSHSSASNVLGLPHHTMQPRSSSFHGPAKTFTNTEILQHVKQLVYTLTVLLGEFRDSSLMVTEIAHSIMYLVDHVMLTQHNAATLRSNQNNFFSLECADLLLALLKKYSHDREALAMLLFLVELLQSHTSPAIPNLGDGDNSSYSAMPLSYSTKDILDAVGMFLVGRGSKTLATILQENMKEDLLVENVLRAILTIVLTYRRQYVSLPRGTMTYIDWSSQVYCAELRDALLAVKVQYVDGDQQTVQQRVITDLWTKTMQFVQEVEEELQRQEGGEAACQQKIVVEVGSAHTDCCIVM